MAIDLDKTSGNTVQPWERLAVTSVVALVGAVILWDGAHQTDDSVYFPIAIGTALIVSSIASLLGFQRNNTVTEEAKLSQGTLGLILLTIFIGSAGAIGFLTTSLLFIPIMAVLGGERNILRILLATILFNILAYIIFTLLFAHPFPAELIFGDLT